MSPDHRFGSPRCGKQEDMDTYRFRKRIHKLPGKVIHAIPLPEPEVTESHGARSKIGDICREQGYKQVLLVTDRMLTSLGYEKAIIASLEAAQVGYTLFNDIDSEPTIAIIEAGRQRALECGADCIVALGGGSVMDHSIWKTPILSSTASC